MVEHAPAIYESASDRPGGRIAGFAGVDDKAGDRGAPCHYGARHDKDRCCLGGQTANNCSPGNFCRLGADRCVCRRHDPERHRASPAATTTGLNRTAEQAISPHNHIILWLHETDRQFGKARLRAAKEQ